MAFFAACSNQDQEGIPAQAEPTASTPASMTTAYGDSDLIKKYLGQINPYIQEVGKIQLEIDKVVGTSQKATGVNLAKAMKKFKPRLETAQTEFTKIQPPPLLGKFHSDIKNLIALRLDANELISVLNGEMAKINQALKTASTATQTASP